MNPNKSWDFGISENPPFPQIEIYLSSIDKEDFQLFPFKIDTGFAGTLGIVPSLIEDLDLKAFGIIPIQTAIGVKDVPYYPLKVKNPDILLAETLLYAIATPRAICGRTFLLGRIWLLDFKNLKFCFCDNNIENKSE